jgi:hypothetical protein
MLNGVSPLQDIPFKYKIGDQVSINRRNTLGKILKEEEVVAEVIKAFVDDTDVRYTVCHVLKRSIIEDVSEYY